MIELPAGTLDVGERPEDCAHRELIEETGYRAGRLEPLCSFYVAPGILDEYMHLFVASELTPGKPAREAEEQIENRVVSWDEALRMIHSGQIDDAKTLIGLLLYDARRKTHPLRNSAP
jgi:ADP-ribose pyrophosphatase